MPAPKIEFVYTGYLEINRKRMAIINGIEYKEGEPLDVKGYILRTVAPREGRDRKSHDQRHADRAPAGIMEASMDDRKIGYPWGGMTIIILSALLITACTGQKEAAKKDPFFEKWTTLAETSPGHSPVPKEKSSAIAQELLKSTGPAGEDLGPPRTLPTQRVSLRMRQADIKSVLRSLARIVDQNVLVKSEIKGEVTIDFRDVPWNQAFNSLLRTQGLTYTWEGDILRVLTFDDLELDLKRKTQELGSKWVEPLLTVIVSIDYAKPKELKDNLETFLTKGKDDKPRGSIRVDEHSNSLIISANKEDLPKMMPIIEKIDRPTAQIQIKANIVETTKDTARLLGIQWGGMYNPALGDHGLWVTPGGSGGSTTTNPTAGGYTPRVGSTGISGQGFGVNFPAAMTAVGAGSLGLMFGTLGGNILEMQLNALQNDSKLNILSSPSTTTPDNQKAFTENGEKVPYSTLDTSVTPPTRTVKFEDSVLRLEITPHVIDGRNLMMKILVKKDEVDLTRQVDG
ncbi:MAG: secretin and TonB N-terminal domain-containing protein, partial [Syntrophales bacterium LBB04]|nr:secretin and TonB N-terminal domain-containing protein [Syntrophales bacterium LBB04]